MKKFIYIYLALSLTFCKTVKVDAIPDEASAIKKAEDTLKKVMDVAEFESMRPFKAKLTNSNKTWEVKSVDIAEFAGLTPIVFINKSNGKIKKILWGEGDIN
ncbi:NTF2 fold immunity protein [Flavobacterium sp. RHBU_3]|uniref:NTF2 fold immunity protein n=1 Tax=Flavobacterium sp. RHBU_3 TaxID=3391184 RepID=UPI0039856502